jgi:integrase
MKKKLTESFVKSATAGNYYDAAPLPWGSLVLRVSPKGKKNWSFAYQHPITKKNTMKRFGFYPDLSVKAARLAAVEMGKNIQAKSDVPAAGQIADTALKFDGIFQHYYDNYVIKFLKKSSIEAVDACYRTTIKPVFSDLLVSEMTYHVIKRALLEIFEERPATARQCLSIISKAFNVALDAEMVDYNPATGVRKFLPQCAPRTRFLHDHEIQKIGTALHGEDIKKAHRVLLMLYFYTMQRSRNLYTMAWSEIDFDQKLWVIPPEKMKTTTVHIVPLSDQAMVLLEDWRQTTEKWPNPEEYVFPAMRPCGDAPAWHIARPQRTQNKIKRQSGVDGWNLHDIRRTSRTLLSRLGIDRAISEQLMAHSEGNKMIQIYDHFDDLTGKRLAMQKLANHLEPLLTSF